MTVTAYPPTVSPAEEIKGRSLWSDAWRRLLHNKAAVVSIVLLLLITLASIFGPLFSSFAYDDVSWDSISIPPYPMSRASLSRRSILGVVPLETRA